MTDQEAVAIVESLRDSTGNATIVAVCDWVLALARREAVNAARRAHRNEYMKVLMKRQRAQKRQARQRAFASTGLLDSNAPAV